MVAGDFRFVNDKVILENHALLDMPLNLAERGWPHYHGIIEVKTQVVVGIEHGERIAGIEIDLIAPDALEILLDDTLLGRAILPPYRFITKSKILIGKHTITLRLVGTSVNLLEEPTPWGISGFHWLISDSSTNCSGIRKLS